MPVTKAVIPAAGLGTRMLPIARAIPKEMLPIVDRPALSYLVEEAVESGATDILIITARGKAAIEDYFDYSPEYEAQLIAKGRADEVQKMREICEKANVHFIRQHEARGLGAAIQCARAFTGNEPFMVLYGDDVIISEGKPAMLELAEAYEKYRLGVCGVKPVSLDQIHKYCSLDARKIDGLENEYTVHTMVEKPKPEQVFTNLAILGRVILPPEIYDILDNTPLGAGNELQLTDAMKTLAETSGMVAVEFEGKRYDLGSKLGLLTANVEQGVKHAEIGEEFKAFIKEFAKTL